jgi:hypothetical protein
VDHEISKTGAAALNVSFRLLSASIFAGSDELVQTQFAAVKNFMDKGSDQSDDSFVILPPLGISISLRGTRLRSAARNA